MQDVTPVVGRIEALLAPVLKAMGYELVRVRLRGGGPRTLQVMIERADARAVGIEDCASASEAISALLDVEDPLPSLYTLEVSSPGIDRPLVKPRDFERFAGCEAKVETLRPIEGRRRFRGRLAPAPAGRVRLAMPEGAVEFSLDEVAEAKLVLNNELIAKARATQDSR